MWAGRHGHVNCPNESQGKSPFLAKSLEVAGAGMGERRVVCVSSDCLTMLPGPQMKTLGLAPEAQSASPEPGASRSMCALSQGRACTLGVWAPVLPVWFLCWSPLCNRGQWWRSNAMSPFSLEPESTYPLLMPCSFPNALASRGNGHMFFCFCFCSRVTICARMHSQNSLRICDSTDGTLSTKLRFPSPLSF